LARYEKLVLNIRSVAKGDYVVRDPFLRAQVQMFLLAMMWKRKEVEIKRELRRRCWYQV